MSFRTMVLIAAGLLVLYTAGVAVGALIAITEVAGRVGPFF